MLARLQEESTVEAAEVDRRGELLRLRLRSSTDTSGVISLLFRLGFAGEVVAQTDLAASRWYGLESVGELSREEARVIAERVVPAFARENHIGASEAQAITDLVAATLHACFLGHPLDAASPNDALNDACGRGVEGATRWRLGPERSAALGKAIEADLASRSAFKA